MRQKNSWVKSAVCGLAASLLVITSLPVHAAEDEGVLHYKQPVASSGTTSGCGGGVGVGNPWPETNYLLPAKEGSAATEGSIEGAGKKTSNMMTASELGSTLTNTLIANGHKEYLKYYIAMQWGKLSQHGTVYDFDNQSENADGKGNVVAPIDWAYAQGKYKDSEGLPRIVKVTRPDNGKSVFVSVVEGGPGVTAGGKPIWQYRNSGLSPDAMSALGFHGTLNSEPGGKGWLTYEWAPNATPGPGIGSGDCPAPGDYLNDNTFPFYKQGGGQPWSNTKVCSGSSSIAAAGCGITSFAMAASAILGQKITPDMAAKKLNVCTNRTSAAGFAPKAAAEYGFHGEAIPLTKAAVEKAFKEGKMVLISVGPSKFTNAGHYLLLRGMTSNGKWKIANSNPKNDQVSNTREYAPEEITSVWHNSAAALWK